VRCEDVAELLPQLMDGVQPADRRIQRHVESCLRCQAELVQYRKLLRALHLLRTEVLEPAPGLLSEILAELEAAGERRAIRTILTGRNAAYVGGIAAATAAGAVGAIVLASRHRSRRLALAS
jgi:Mg-chelatase subunit ChlI